MRDWRRLHSKIEAFLLTAGPLLHAHSVQFQEASEIFDWLRSGKRNSSTSEAYRMYAGKIEKRLSKAVPAPEPKPASRSFPFNPPMPTLQEQLHKVEHLLAPLSGKRRKAAAFSKDLPARFKTPSLPSLES